MEPASLLGYSVDQWSIINGLANWVVAVGTLGAVIVSLFLALRSTRPRATLSVGIRQIIAAEYQGDFPEVIAIRMVNIGERLINVTNMGWRVGFFWKRFAVQHVNPTSASQGIPASLEYGHEASWHIPTDAQGGWCRYFYTGFLRNMSIWKMRSLRLVVYTSTGYQFKVRPESSLFAALANASKAEKQNQAAAKTSP